MYFSSLVAFLCICDAKKVLFIPLPQPSHVMEQQQIANALLDMNYKVDMLLPESKADSLLQSEKIGKVRIKGQFFFDQKKQIEKDMLAMLKHMDIITILRWASDEFVHICEAFMQEKDNIVQKLKKGNYDLLILDLMPFSECLLLVAYKSGR